MSLRDLPATVLDLVGTEIGGLPGESLRRYWELPSGTVVDTLFAEVSGGFSEAPWEPIEKGDLRSAFIGPYHYIRNADGSEELYDIVADPDEVTNLVSEPSCADMVARLRAALESRGVGSSVRSPLLE